MTESSEHNAEYLPYFIKDKYPERSTASISSWMNIPAAAWNQIAEWEKRRDELTTDPHLTHGRAANMLKHIMEAMETNRLLQNWRQRDQYGA